MIRRVLLAVAALYSAIFLTISACANQCEPLSEADLYPLLAATDVRQLDAAAPAQDGHPALHALYRSRRYSFVPTASEARRYFRSLPRSQNELWCVYTLTMPNDTGNNLRIAEAVYGMFDRAAHIARMLGTGHDRVLQLALWSDGELAYHSWDAVEWLLENDPILTAAAIKRLPNADQKRMCRGQTVNSLTTRNIVGLCRPDN